MITVVNLLSQFLVPNTAAATMDVLKGLPFLVLVLIMVLMPTFVEKIGFCGILLQNYRESGVWRGILLSALLVIMVFVYGIFAVIGTALAIPVYKGIASASGRAGYISALFKGNVRPYETQKILTIPLVLAIICSVIYPGGYSSANETIVKRLFINA